MRRILAFALFMMPNLARAQPYTPIPLVTQEEIWTIPQWNQTWTTLNSLFLNPVLSGLGNGTVTATGATTAQSLSSITARIYAVEDFGAVGNGITDDSVAFASCISAAATNHGVCFLANKQYYIASSITIPAYTALKGGSDPGEDVPVFNSSVLRPMIFEGGGVTINVAGELSNAAVVRANTNLNPTSAQNVISAVAAYNGTGITLTGPAVLEHDVIIGMAQAINTNGQANFKIRHIRGDNTAGLYITGMFDWGWADDIEWNPFLAPSVGSQTPSSIVTGATNNGSGAIRLSVSSTTPFVTGNSLIVYGVTGSVPANGRWPVTVINGTQIDLVGSTYSGSYTSGGTVVLNTETRSGAAYAIDTSASPLLTQISELGYDTGLYIGHGAQWVKVEGYSQDTYNIPDPGVTAIDIESDAFAPSIDINYIGGFTPIKVNTTSPKPVIIHSGAIYSSGFGVTQPLLPNINVVQGTLILDSVDCSGMTVFVGSSAGLLLSNSYCNGASWFAGSNFSKVNMSNTVFGDVTGNSLRGPRLHMMAGSGATWSDNLDVTTSAITANVPINLTSSSNLQFNGSNFLVAGTAANNPAVIIGQNAGSAFPVGNPWLTAVGSNSLQNYGNSGGEITALGNDSCWQLVSGSQDLCAGQHSGGSETSSSGYTAIGSDNMRNTIGAANSTSVGANAGRNGSAGNNVSMGYAALEGNATSIIIGGTKTTGDTITLNFTSTGSGTYGFPASTTYTVQAGDTLATIASNLATAINALGMGGPLTGVQAFTTGLTGSPAIIGLDFPGSNSAGYAVSVSSSTSGGATETVTIGTGFSGFQNVAVGSQAMLGLAATTATNVTAIGYQSLPFVTSLSNSLAAGTQSGYSTQSGSGDTFVGYQTGYSMTGPNKVSAFGQSVGSTTCTSPTNVLLLGTDVNTTCTSATESNVIHIGAGAADIISVTGTGTPSSSATVVAGTLNVVSGYKSNGTAGVTCSGTPTSSFASVNGIVTHC